MYCMHKYVYGIINYPYLRLPPNKVKGFVYNTREGVVYYLNIKDEVLHE